MAEGSARAEGRKRVREWLAGPMAGLPRARRTSAEAHAKAMERLVDKLSYLTPQNLDALGELVLRQAGAVKTAPCWPEASVVIAWAYAMQPPPPRESTYAVSIMRSVMGRRAREGGYAVELYRVARRLGPPPNRYVMSQLVQQADDNMRRRARVAEWIAAGAVKPEDRAWWDAWWHDAAEVDAILRDQDQDVDGEEVAA